MKKLIQKREFLLALIRDAQKERISLEEISFNNSITYLFRSIEYLSDYSEKELKSGSQRSLYDLRRMACFICFNDGKEKSVAKKLQKNLVGKKYVFIPCLNSTEMKKMKHIKKILMF